MNKSVKTVINAISKQVKTLHIGRNYIRKMSLLKKKENVSKITDVGKK